jgi:Mg2+ and Co2+ transporter CorA
MTRVENWAAVMGINDKKMLDEIHMLDDEIVSILKLLGAKER